MNHIQQTDIIQLISLDCFDIPYEDYGRSKDGCDCWGLVVVIFGLLGIELDTYNESYTANDKEGISELIENEKSGFERIDDPQPLDIVILRILGYPWHCGVYLGNGCFIHIQKKIGVTIENVNSHKWYKRINGYYRHCK